MKLTTAQQNVLDKAKSEIDLARTLDYPEWFKTTQKWVREDRVDKLICEGHLKANWEAKRRGEVITHCNSKTLKKLEEYGLIEIIEDSNGESFGLDVVKVLNY